MKSLEQRCAESGLKMTAPRKVILQVMQDADDHPSVETVYERVKAIDSSISMATVYRTINMLDELGLLVRHEFKENYARFELDDGHHHHHLIDTESGEIIEFHSEELEKLQQKLAAELGYEMIDHSFEIYGRKIKS